MEYHRKYTAGSNSRNPDRQMESLQLGGKHSKELPFITSLHFLSHSCNNKTNPYFIQFNMGGKRRRLCLAHNTFTCRANLKTKSFLDKKVSCIFRILQHEPLVSSQHILHRKPTSTKHSLLASTVCCDIGLGTYVSTACRYTMQQCSTSSVDNIEGSGKTA